MAKFLLIATGTNCVPKHTSVARKKLPKKELDYNTTSKNWALFYASNLSTVTCLQTKDCKQQTSGHSWKDCGGLPVLPALRSNWGLIMSLIKILLILMGTIQSLRIPVLLWSGSSEVWLSNYYKKDSLPQAEKAEGFQFTWRNKRPFPTLMRIHLEVIMEN